MNSNISNFNFPNFLKVKVKEQSQSIEFRLPINLPQRVKKLLDQETQFSNIKIIHIFDKIYLLRFRYRWINNLFIYAYICYTNFISILCITYIS